jgi:hypothetical protein
MNFEDVGAVLSPWRRVLLEKLTFAQLVKKLSANIIESEVSLPCSQERAASALILSHINSLHTFSLGYLNST